MAKQNTKIESEGAEFLVLGNLLIQKIPAYKAYSNMPGYDIIATNPDQNSSVRIQVKSRWATKANSFIINKFNCDFVVLVKLNRGSKNQKDKILPPEYFVLPVDFVKSLPQSDNWGKINFKDIPDLESFKDRWDLVVKFLESVHSI